MFYIDFTIYTKENLGEINFFSCHCDNFIRFIISALEYNPPFLKKILAIREQIIFSFQPLMGKDNKAAKFSDYGVFVAGK